MWTLDDSTEMVLMKDGRWPFRVIFRVQYSSDIQFDMPCRSSLIIVNKNREYDSLSHIPREHESLSRNLVIAHRNFLSLHVTCLDIILIFINGYPKFIIRIQKNQFILNA